VLASLSDLLDGEGLLPNIPDLDGPTLLVLYRRRWPIELLFKACQSPLKFATLGHWRAPRLFCQLYARLIGLVLALTLSADLRSFQATELSFPKALQLLQRTVPALLSAIAQDWSAWLTPITRLREKFLRFARKDKRKKSPSILHLVASLKA
jgi:hypothetical protein